MLTYLRGVVIITAFIYLCITLLVINQDMAIQGKYAEADQFLYSLNRH